MKHLQQAKIKILPWVMLAASSFLFGCAAEDQSNKSCIQRLDEQSFTSVIEDTSCSTYERGSAHLGAAGFLFSNFLKDGASDNFRAALGVPSDASWDTWAGKAHYEAAMQLTGDQAGATSADENDYYYGQSRSNADVEIHYFSTLASVLASTYIQLDVDGDGTISEFENQLFTNINPSTSADYGSNDVVPTSFFQVSSGTTGYIVNLATGDCWLDTNGDGLEAVNGTAAQTILTCGMLTLAKPSFTGECSLIAKVNNIQKLFKTTISTSSNVLTMTEDLVAKTRRMYADIATLGLADGSDMKKSLDDFSAKIDNGGGCTQKDSLKQVNKLMILINAANKSSLGSATGSYLNANKLSLLALASSSDKPISTPSTNNSIGINCTNSTGLSARLVFQTTATSGVYTADYDSSAPGIQSTFGSLQNIQLGADGLTKPIVKGDDIISFEELVCME